MASAPEGDSALHKLATATTQPTPQATPTSLTTPQVPNIHASGSNPTPEQVQSYCHKHIRLKPFSGLSLVSCMLKWRWWHLFKQTK